MQNFEIMYRSCRGGAIVVLLILLFWSKQSVAQDMCIPALCGNLKVEVVRQDANVTPSCPTSTTACTDRFRQIAYKVYLRHTKTVSQNDPLLPFNLDYKELDVAVKLRNNGLPRFSHIDVGATQNCFASGHTYWNNYSNLDGDKVIFTPTADDVSISFANLASNSPNCGSTGANNTGNIITFSYNPVPLVDVCGGQNQSCAYVELFTVVVNAYPGETLSLEFNLNQLKYLPKSGGNLCSPIPQVNSGPNNGLSNIVVGAPVTYIGSGNATIEAQLLTEEPTADGGYDFPVALKNTGNTDRTVAYAEFVLKATTALFDRPFTYTLATPRVHEGGTNPQTGVTTRYLHYLINTPITLQPGQTIIISKIKMGPPILWNQAWATSLDFEGAATKARVTSDGNCTLLKTSGGPKVTSSNGDALCADPTVHFKVEGIFGGCNDIRARIQLYSSNPPAGIQLSKVAFRLTFDFSSPDISINSLDFSNWPAVVCSTSGCYNGQCYTISPDGKTLDYCFSVPANTPAFFNLNPMKYIDVVFGNTGVGCITGVTVNQLAITYTNTIIPCIPVIDEPEGFSLCANSISGRVETELGDGVEAVTMHIYEASSSCSNVNCPIPCSILPEDLTDVDGYFLYCDLCNTCNKFLIEPEKDDNPLNGVTTYDLVLISKHILGTDPFDTPFKMIAADANKSGSITTFDIVELRKLILGQYTELPNNKSWRFVDKGYSFPNMNNPFNPPFPETKDCIGIPDANVSFTGIKIGDVNNTNSPHSRPAERLNLSVTWPTNKLTSGNVITLPIQYAGTSPIEAIQMGLQFDPEVLQLIGPSLGEMESWLPDNFNLQHVSRGEIRTLWFPLGFEETQIKPGTILFYLSFKVLTDIKEGELPLRFDNNLLDCAVWEIGGREYSLTHQRAIAVPERSTDIPAGLKGFVHPNPTTGTATLSVEAERASKTRIMVFDGFGRRIFIREQMLTTGKQEIPLLETETLPAGVYIWKLITPEEKVQGHLIKQ